MAVALNPTKTLYSKKSEKSEVDPKLNSSSYADSPSRQLRRSARVASLSPSSFTPLISQQSGTSSASSSTSTSSYLPNSPSSKYSMMRGGYNGMSIDEIVINEIEPENRKINYKSSSSTSSTSSFYPTLESFTNLRSNPDRKHPTLDFQPTNLSTPSTTLESTNKSGITPAVNKINLQETTPGQSSQRILEKLVTKGDMEEIAKATPLGSFFNRKATETVSAAAVGPEKSKIQITLEKSKETKPAIIYTNNSTNNNTTNTANNNNSNNNTNTTNTTNIHSYSLSHSHSHSNNMTRTPQKQTSTSDPVDSDETVKVVRTLRNRSIVASPLPASSALRRNSLAAPRENKTKIDVTVFFKKHQKNLLAYSLVGLFLLATLYHIYDGLTSSSSSGSVHEEDNTVNTVDIVREPMTRTSEEILKLIDTKFTEIQENEKEKILNLLEKSQETFNKKLDKVNEKLEKPVADAEMQRKALDSVAKSVKSLEKKFQALEAKIEEVEKAKIAAVAAAKEAEAAAVAVAKEAEETAVNKQAEVAANKQAKEAVNISEAPATTNVSEESANVNRPEASAKPANSYSSPRYATLKVVKHLSTSPIGGSLFKSSDFPPENALSSHASPFKFAGNRGKLAVLLPHPSPAHLPTHVTLEHPLLPDRSCAPRDIEIWALPNALNERDHPLLISKGTFDLSKASQSFKLNQQKLAQLEGDKDIVLQLRIRNNHGDGRVTCLYNFKVQL